MCARTLEIEANAVSDNPLLFGEEAIVRRQFPRPAGRLRGGHPRDRAVRDRLDLRAAARRPGRSQDERPAALPDRGQRRQFGLHDRAGDRRRSGLREQDARLSGQRRHDPDLGRAGGPCLDGDARRAQGAADRAQCRRRDRDRIAGRGAGRSTSTRRCRPRRALGAARDAIRAGVPFHDADRYLAPDIAWAKAAVLDGALATSPRSAFSKRERAANVAALPIFSRGGDYIIMPP